MDFEHSASVHPRTVTAISEAPPAKQARRFYGRAAHDRPQSRQVHPEVWRLALEAAHGHANRIEVLSETEVYIHNDADWRQKR